VKATDARLDDLYRDGLSIAEIAARTGVAPSTTRRRLIAAGVELREPGTPRIRPTLTALRHLRDDLALRPSEIARRYQVAPSTVTAWLDHYQLPHPTHGQPPTVSVLRSEYTDAGMTLAEIGDNHAVTRQTVARWLDAAQIPRRSGVPLDPTEVARAYRTEQLSCHAIGRRVGASESTIRRILCDHDVERRQPLPAVTRAALEAALAQHMTAPQIAQALGCSITAVCRALTRENLETASQQRRRESRERLAATTHN